MSASPISPAAPLAADLDRGLSELFGFDQFRQGQREVASSLMESMDVLAVMPTGAGKSLCYQLPGCLVDGLAVVVSPLIALMKDQVDALREKGIPAYFINSTLGWHEQQARLRAIEEGECKLIFVAPERFRNEAFLETIEQVEIGLLAIDEAHCISQWGHDFRPDYLELGEIRELLGSPPTIALTATATPEVQADILKQLGMEEARVIVSGFDRPNLYFEVVHVRSDEDKYSRLERMLSNYRGESVVVYCATRRQVEEVRARLKHMGHLVASYHGGLSDKQRETVQDAFMAGDVPVLVATNAFGMGVDKSDVRAIVHFNVPGSLEAYYQEAGRAGRDGEFAHCLLFYHPNDRGVHEFFIETSFPTPDAVMSVWTELRRYGVGTHSIGPQQIADNINKSSRGPRVHNAAVEASLRLLKQASHVDYGWRDGFPWVSVLDHSRQRDLRIDWDHVVLRREIAQRQLDDMMHYSVSEACRQVVLLRHFNADSGFGNGCDNCDRCCGEPAFEPPRAGMGDKIRVHDDATTLMRKILSGVARGQGRHDTHAIAAMLRGSSAQRMTRTGLDRLSTYGLLSELLPGDIVTLLELAQRHHLITRSARGKLALTDEGVEVMTGEGALPTALEARLDRRLTILSH